MVDDLKAMIQINFTKNNKVTTDYVYLATKAYVLDVGWIKGRTTRSRPTPVVRNIVEIPEEFLEIQKDLTVFMDELTVNSLKFLSTISHDLCYGTAQYVKKPVPSIYKGCMYKPLELYKKGGFNITEIHCDN